MVTVRPYFDHINVTIASRDVSEERLWIQSHVSYKYVEVNGIPIVAFLFLAPSLNFFVHINYPELKEIGTDEWLERETIKINLQLFDPTGTIKIGDKEISISRDDSNKIKDACKMQQSESIVLVDAAIDFIYANDISEYDWMKS